VLATFGVQAAKKNGEASKSGGDNGVTKKDMERLIETASQTAPSQTIRIEQAPVVISAVEPKG